MADNDDPTYPIGYKKPPRDTQFKPGQSGNFKGRPKGAKNFATVIEKELRTSIEVTENGKRKRITKREAVAKQAVNKAANGDPKATAMLLNEARFYESQNPSPVAQTTHASPEDQKVMENIRRRILQADPIPLEPELSQDHTSDNQPEQPPPFNEGEL
jgi:hypothetical protein